MRCAAIAEKTAWPPARHSRAACERLSPGTSPALMASQGLLASPSPQPTRPGRHADGRGDRDRGRRPPLCAHAPTWCKPASSGRSACCGITARQRPEAKFLGKLLSGRYDPADTTEPERVQQVTDLKNDRRKEGTGYRGQGSKIFTTHSGLTPI